MLKMNQKKKVTFSPFHSKLTSSIGELTDTSIDIFSNSTVKTYRFKSIFSLKISIFLSFCPIIVSIKWIKTMNNLKIFVIHQIL
jgi:hypothetical protein